MSRSQQTDFPAALVFDQLTDFGEEAPGIEEKLLMLRTLRGASVEATADLDRLFLTEFGRLRTGLVKTQQAQHELHGSLKSSPRRPASRLSYLNRSEIQGMLSATVQQGSERRVVALGDEIDVESLEVGDELLLTAERNVALAESPVGSVSSGETGTFSRYTPAGRLVLKSRDEELIVIARPPAAGHRTESRRRIALRPHDLDRIREDRALERGRVFPGGHPRGIVRQHRRAEPRARSGCSRRSRFTASIPRRW